MDTAVLIPADSCSQRDQARWQAVLARHAPPGDPFVYAVRTTGVYCRPGAGARLPRRENVVFFDTPGAAEAAGYRPSRRLAAPPRAPWVEAACRRIEAAETLPSLAELAADSGLSPYHFHRLFKAQTGLTPRAYAQAQRARRLRERLGQAPRVTDAVYEAGFGAPSRFYEQAAGMLGMPARDWRAGGRNARIRFAVAQCSLGALLVAQSQQGLCAVSLGEDPEALVRDLQDRFPLAEFTGGDAQFEQLVAQVVGLVEAPGLGLDLPLDVRGTAFQERVWRALRDIAPGSTASYAEIAERIGAPRAVRAVAQACAANPLAVLIPCHRVVRRDGDLSGYRWGVARKRELLAREAGSAAAKQK
ncbi:bifunctional DNA-binding transcriptional regulator/O6-methylguanine-DNA methyltransferase Ada [Orrella sp. JC864]|uniref:bifunctional DNA-binding transcriptional regulator/O6-methylguanine-DNA methyltransferase Ada n=1 Tax=Orrella sp. JC864 TaxID=3120298 RepID=UPI00300B8CA4